MQGIMLLELRKKIRRNLRLKNSLYPLYSSLLWISYVARGRKIYRNNLKMYKKNNRREEFAYNAKCSYPIYADRYKSAGHLGAYFWQDLWAAKLIKRDNPEKHYDIGSRIDGFIGHLASFRDNIILLDVRPMKQKIPGVSFIQTDATTLEEIDDASVKSISALCSLEHFGLGRYGDPINPEGSFEAFLSIKRVLAKGGHCYISVPIGREHLEFDAHRVFYASTIVREFEPLELLEFSCIHPYDEGIEQNVNIHKYDEDCEVGGLRMGLFHFVKR